MKTITLLCFLVVSSTAFADFKTDLKSHSSNKLFSWSLGMEPASGSLYKKPDTSKFKPFYDADKANQNKQSWSQYSGWVSKFYTGTTFSRGHSWNNTTARVLEGVSSTQLKRDMTGFLNVLGRVIAAEWAKDNGVRKISTTDVKRWGEKLNSIKGNDPDGTKRYQYLKTIAREAAGKLR